MAGVEGGFIVVGFDGTPESVAALRWALGRAAGMQVPVKVVRCWAPLWVDAAVRRQQRIEAVRELRSEVAAARTLVPQPPGISIVFGSSSAESVLAAQARGASMLVLGASSREVLAAPESGPVAGPCLQRVGCPIVVVDGHGRVSTAQPQRPVLGLVS